MVREREGRKWDPIKGMRRRGEREICGRRVGPR